MRVVRSSLVALLFAAAIPAAVPSAHSQSPPDTTGILTPWRIEPYAPCVHDSVFMVVRGFVATPCDSFLGAEALDPRFVRIRLQTYGDRDCFAPPSEFYPVRVALGRFPAGPQSGIVQVELTTVFANGPPTRSAQRYAFGFTVDPQCEIPPPGPPPTGLPFVHHIGTEPHRPCAGRPTSLVLSGMFRDGCGQVIDAVVHDPRHVELTLKPDVLPDTACTLNLQPWRQVFDLGTLPASYHRTDITLHVVQRDSAGTALVRNTYQRSFEFWVFADCDSVPAPVPGPLPYVRHIRIASSDPCEPEPPCSRDSLAFGVWGEFPSDCFSFRRILVMPSPATVVPPEPPTVRIIVDDGGCLGRPCANIPVFWSAQAILPPQPAGHHRLKVELAQVTCSDTYPPGQLYRTEVPFAVSDSCYPGVCLTAGFAPGPDPNSACNAMISKLQPAELTFQVRPNVALAGLQGVLRLDPPALRITRIEPIGHAAGMLLNWSAEGDGARFVLFAQSGAPIPPYPPIDVEGGGWPVLAITVQSLTRVPIPGTTVVYAEQLLGSDIDGNAVPYCPPPPCARANPGLPPPAADPRLILPPRALICAERLCDFNADGSQDVRDLVLMVHCVNGQGPCPPDAATRFDCDADGAFGLADVICCAHHVLLRPPCPECPPDSGGSRPEPGVAVSFDPAVENGQDVDLAVRIAGADRLGAAMLTLEAPLGRYDVTAFDVEPPGHWLALHEVRDGHIVLGLLDVTGGNQRATPDNSRFTLHLRLKPGATPGGQVAAVAGEFSGPDGVALRVHLGRPRQSLPGGAAIVLSRNQPNPFSAETRFTLEVPTPANVTVGIYDLRGRVVAILHRGLLASGPQEFRWDGRRTDGSAAPDGVYFYHAAVGEKTLARKLILMRRD